MTDDRVIERKTVTDDGIERRETTETTGAPASTTQTLEKGVHHGDEEAGGALAGVVGGAAVGAVVGGPVGAVVGGAIGAASGATAGALDDKRKDEEVVVTKEEKTW
jgi:outer membrane lipoprotein SlyB